MRINSGPWDSDTMLSLYKAYLENTNNINPTIGEFCDYYDKRNIMFNNNDIINLKNKIKEINRDKKIDIILNP